jgi:hypothetical protein
VASKNLVGRALAAHLLDHNLTPEQLGAKVGLSGMTIRRIIDPDTYGPLVRDHHISTKFAIARELREDPSTLWPPIPLKRKVGA